MKYAVFSCFGGRYRQEGQETNNLSIAKYLLGRACGYYESRGYIPHMEDGRTILRDRAGLEAGTLRICKKGEGEATYHD